MAGNSLKELPERLESIPPEQRNNYAVSALREKLEDEDWADLDALSDNYPRNFPVTLRRENCTLEEIALIEKGIQDIEAGHGIDGETLMANLFERVGLPYPPVPSVQVQ